MPEELREALERIEALPNVAVHACDMSDPAEVIGVSLAALLQATESHPSTLLMTAALAESSAAAAALGLTITGMILGIACSQGAEHPGDVTESLHAAMSSMSDDDWQSIRDSYGAAMLQRQFDMPAAERDPS